MIQRIVIPYFVFALLLGDGPYINTITTIIYGSSKTLGNVTGSHLWFLPCYFVSVVLFHLSSTEKWFNKMFVFVLFVVLAYITRDEIVSQYLSQGLPWGVNAAFMGCALIYLGQFARIIWNRLHSVLPMNRIVVMLISLMFASVGLLLIGNNTGSVNIAFAKYGNIFFFLLSNLLMLIAVLLFSEFIDNEIFSYYGSYTLPIYAFHFLILVFYVKIFDHFNVSPLFPNIYAKCGTFAVLTLVTSCLIINPLKKYFPNLVGDF